VIRLETHIEVPRNAHKTVDVVVVDVLAHAGEGHQAVQRPAVQQVETKQISNLVSDRALAGCGRAVDGDDRVRHGSSGVGHDENAGG
jgi:hypothetical protein